MKPNKLPALLLGALSFSASADGVDNPSNHNWGGFYVGINAGYGLGATTGSQLNHGSDLDGTFVNGNGNLPANFSLNANGGLAGGQLGYNWQIDRFLLGLETDFQGSDINDTTKQNTSLGGGFCNSSSLGMHNLNYFGTARMRFGMSPLDNLLVYVTGGYAYGRTHTEADTAWNLNGNACQGPINGSKNDTLSGWTTGLGGEYLLSDTWSVKAEYLHMGLGNSQVTANIPSNLQTAEINYKFNNSFDIFRIGVNLHF